MLNQDNDLPEPWARVHADFLARYTNVRCERWCEPLVEIANGLPFPVYYDDRVLRGFGRKAAAAMRSTCANCGRPGRLRTVGGSMAVACGACFGKVQMARQIESLLEECRGEVGDPFDGPRAAWHEYDLSPLLRSAIPAFCWRYTNPPGSAPIRYLARDDVARLAPWLAKLSEVMLR